MNGIILKAYIACAFFFWSAFTVAQMDNIDVQGHRGFRGMYPENTIPAFQHAIDLGVTTLEMDIVLSSENTWFVSHEPWLNHQICKDIQGRRIKKEHEQTFNLYWLSDPEIKSCDCGSIQNPNFPDQITLPVAKPTLQEVLEFCEDHAHDKGRTIKYNIEIKSVPEWEGIYQPGTEEYVDYLTDFMDRVDFMDRITIQCFDERILRLLHEQRPEWNLAYLVSNLRSLDSNVEFLGFTPTIYSPNYRFVTHKTIEQAKKMNIILIPWTVNNETSMKRLIDLGVDGIITDYPDRLLRLISRMKAE